MKGGVEIISLSGGPADIERFLKVAFRIYQNDPLWVAPIIADLKKVFSRRNPFFQHAEMNLWVARRNGADVGRLAGIMDRQYHPAQNQPTAFFGFFETIKDAQASHALFETVFRWAWQKGARHILGPMNPSTNDECGLLVHGFDNPPVFMMSYNPPYYEDLIMAEGMAKAKDLLAFRFDVQTSPRQRLEKIAASFEKRHHNLRVRPVTRRSLQRDLARIKEIYNSAWEDNWGFVPMTDAEIDFMAERLKPLLREGLVWLAETPEEPAAFFLAVPDYNEVIKPLQGRLLTLNLLKTLPYWFGWKQPSRVRVVALGVKKKFRGRGIESVMFARSLAYSLKAGFQTCEASWILEDNISVQRLIELFGGVPYKTYRLYERPLVAPEAGTAI